MNRKYAIVIEYHERFFNTKLKGELSHDAKTLTMNGEFENGYKISYTLIDMEKICRLTYDLFYDMMTQIIIR